MAGYHELEIDVENGS